MPTTSRVGATTIGGKQNLDLQRNSRMGATFSSSAPTRRQAIRVSVSRGAYTTIGADFPLDCSRLQLRVGAVTGLLTIGWIGQFSMRDK